MRGFPGGPVVKNLPCNAGEHRFDPWFHEATEPVCINSWAGAP